MILIVSNPLDSHADRVEEHLDSAGASFLRLDPTDFPAVAGATVRMTAQSEPEVFFCAGDRRCALVEAEVVWWRRPARPTVAEGLDPANRGFAQNESEHLLNGVWKLLGDRFWVNPLAKARAAELKLPQLAAARAVGLRTPATVITNEPSEALAFVSRVGGQVVYKTLAFFDRTKFEPGVRGIFTTIIDVGDLARRAEQIRLAPCLFQEYVPKRVEIRATVVGEEIFAAEIDSQRSEISRVDWRRYDFENVAYRPHSLPDAVGAQLLAIMARLGLVFGCFDLILTPDGEYVFLEVNQAGQWYWIEILTGLPITKCFARFLMAARAGRAHAAATA